jgi:inosose dehydratase
VIAWLDAHSYRGYVTVEQDVLPGMGTPKESARRNRQLLRGLGI